MPAVDVNKALAERYIVDAPIQVTLSMVWDMELKKSWEPLTYIPYVVSDGKSCATPHFLIGLIAYALRGGNPAKSVRKDARMKIDIFNQ